MIVYNPGSAVINAACGSYGYGGMNQQQLIK